MLTAYNANYDCRFLLEHLYAEKALMKGRRFLNIDAVYYKQSGEKLELRIKDSYKIISMPLSEFPKAFKLDSIKEIMPYNEYTRKHVTKILVRA